MIKLSDDTIKKIKNRNRIFKEAKIDKTKEKSKEARSMRNKVNRMISYDRYIENKNRLKKVEHDTDKLWNEMKKTVNMSNEIVPQMIIENGNIITKHVELANSINRQFIKQAEDTINGIENNNIDTMDHYRSKIVKPKQLFF